jgi:hypothetical protein
MPHAYIHLPNVYLAATQKQPSIAVVRRGGVHERLRGGDAMFLQHHHERLGVDDRAGVKQFHAKNLTAEGKLKMQNRTFAKWLQRFRS